MASRRGDLTALGAEPGTVCLQCGWPASTLRPGEVCGPIIPQANCPSCGVRLLPALPVEEEQ